MSTVFLVLFLFFTGFLVWGLIAPKKLSKFANKSMSRKEAGVGFGVLAFVFFMLTGLTAPKQSVQPAQSDQGQVAGISDTLEQAKQQPVIGTVSEDQAIAFGTETTQDPNLAQGSTRIITKGINGTKKVTYETTTLDGKETGRKAIKEDVVTPPVNQVTAVGTKVAAAPQRQQSAPARSAAPASNCHPSYSGACVPIASDVDCSSGSGNGPAYVRGPVRVIGPDVYDLDRDGNGTGCENG